MVKAFCVIAGVNLCFSVLVLCCLNHAFGSEQSVWLYPMPLTSVALYILFIPSYIVFYVSTQLNSPSKSILLELHLHGPTPYAKLQSIFTDDVFIFPRMKDLERTNCITIEQELVSLTEGGKKIGAFLMVYQKMLGRGAGG